MEFLERTFKQIKDFLNAMSMRKKVAISITGVTIVASILGLFIWASDRTYQPLMTNLNPEDSSNIIRVLRERNIPFKVDQSGRSIMVTPENMDQLRMELAIMGLPQSSVVGYEVFDKNSLGQTSFVQRVNEKRAKEGELTRTINTIHGVRRSRVHLAIPQKSTFVEDQKKATASVVLDMVPGINLTDRQIAGVANLVARAVEGLDTNDVAIVDSLGKMLSKAGNDSFSQLSSNQQEFKTKIESDMERRVQEILSRVVGDGKVVAKVTADLDFTSINETQTIYDQDGATVKSMQENSQSMEGSKPIASGAAGAQSNTPLGQSGPTMAKVQDTKVGNKVVNYAIPETIRKTIRTPGAIKKLSVAVVVDGKQVKEKDKEGVVQSKTQPWAPEQIKEFESLVASTLGVDKKRGDSLEIKNMEFTPTDFSEAEALLAEKERKAYINNLIIYAAMALVIVLFFMMVVRPFIRWITDNTTDNVETFLPQTLEELEKVQKGALPGLEDAIPTVPDQIDPEKVESEMVKEKVITLVDANPSKAALIIRDWLHLQLEAKKGADDKEEKKDGSKTA